MQALDQSCPLGGGEAGQHVYAENAVELMHQLFESSVLPRPEGRMSPGVVGQFLGDGIMAFFDVKPDSAIRAALQMKKALPSFNKDIEEYGLKPLEIGIGLNLGEGIFSIIGEKERLEAHVISDHVNLAARVESLNKYYKTAFLITDVVYDRIADRSEFLIRLIDKVIVMGRTQAVKVYEVKSLPEGEALEAALAYIALFNQAFAAYEKGDFTKAASIFDQCLAQNPDDAVAQLLKLRCIEFEKIGTPSDWDGTFKMTEK